MIVVDTNIIAYLLISGHETALAQEVFKKDSDWVAPSLWESEFLSVLSKYMRQGLLTCEDAISLMTEAKAVMDQASCDAPEGEVLKLVDKSNCSSYDCEYVALAQHLDVPLVTGDRRILREFSSTAIGPEAYVAEQPR